MGETTEILTIEELYKCVYIIRGQQVMFDQDLAAIYGYEVKRLNEQVKRNISRFPEDFMFQIEPEEVPDRLKSQIATLNGSNNKRGMHIKKMPYAWKKLCAINAIADTSLIHPVIDKMLLGPDYTI